MARSEVTGHSFIVLSKNDVSSVLKIAVANLFNNSTKLILAYNDRFVVSSNFNCAWFMDPAFPESEYFRNHE